MNNPYEEQEDMKQARGEYDGLEGVGEFDIPEPTADDAMSEPDQLPRALIAYRIIQLDNIRKAAIEQKQSIDCGSQDTFLIDALKRNKVVPRG